MPTRPIGPTSQKPSLQQRAVVLRVAVGRAVVSAPYRWLTVWLIGWTTLEILLSRTHMYSWHYVLAGSSALRAPDWFTLYGRHPELQMGPLTFLLAEPFSFLPKELGRVVGAAMMAAVGLAIVREIRLLLPDTSAADARRWILISAVVLVGWLEVAVRFGHLDDVMTLLCGLAALRAVRTNRSMSAGVLIGLSIDFKPWAVPFAALLVSPPTGRQRAGALALAALVVLSVWSPFLVLDPHVLAATRFRIHVDPASTLHLLGLAGSSTPPWCRPAQVIIGSLLALAALRSGRWSAVLVLVIAVRLLLDPATQPYYDSGLLVGAGILDLGRNSGRRSWRSWRATAAVLLFVYLPSYLLTQLPELRGLLRLVGLVSLIALAFLLRPDRPDARPEAGPGGSRLQPGEATAAPASGAARFRDPPPLPPGSPRGAGRGGRRRDALIGARAERCGGGIRVRGFQPPMRNGRPSARRSGEAGRSVMPASGAAGFLARFSVGSAEPRSSRARGARPFG